MNVTNESKDYTAVTVLTEIQGHITIYIYSYMAITSRKQIFEFKFEI